MGEVSARDMRAPWEARRRAVARPMPDAAPVIAIVLEAKDMVRMGWWTRRDRGCRVGGRGRK